MPVIFMLGSVLLNCFSEGQLRLKLMQSDIALPRVVFPSFLSHLKKKKKRKSHDPPPRILGKKSKNKQMEPN